MKKLIMLFIATLIFPSLATKAQNLVPNWSFEQYDTCPYTSGQIYYATGWENIMIVPDYYNACASNQYITVPTNFGTGYRYSDTSGIAMAGIDAYEVCPRCQFPPNLHEILGCQLYFPLEIGKKYFVSFTVRFALENGSFFNGAISHLGALFSTVSYTMSRDSAIYIGANERVSKVLVKNRAQVYTTTVITDTAYWTVISGSFIADSTYSYINIGDFFDDTLSNFTLIYNDTASNSSQEFAYYFIDDVCVVSDSLNSCALVATGVNKIIPINDSLMVTPNPMKNMTIISIPSLSNINSEGHIFGYDILGNRIRDAQIKFSNGEYVFPRENLADGMYFILLEIGNKMFKQKIAITN